MILCFLRRHYDSMIICRIFFVFFYYFRGACYVSMDFSLVTRTTHHSQLFMAGNANGTFQQKSFTQHRKTYITQPKHMLFCQNKEVLKAQDLVLLFQKKKLFFVLGVAQHGDPSFAQVGPKKSYFQRFQQIRLDQIRLDVFISTISKNYLEKITSLFQTQKFISYHGLVHLEYCCGQNKTKEKT